jgi:hypothetical protein
MDPYYDFRLLHSTPKERQVSDYQRASKVRQMAKTYDKKCWDLAVHFLSDEPELDSPANCNELAGAIQEAIELWFHDRHR